MSYNEKKITTATIVHNARNCGLNISYLFESTWFESGQFGFEIDMFPTFGLGLGWFELVHFIFEIDPFFTLKLGQVEMDYLRQTHSLLWNCQVEMVWVNLDLGFICSCFWIARLQKSGWDTKYELILPGLPSKGPNLYIQFVLRSWKIHSHREPKPDRLLYDKS